MEDLILTMCIFLIYVSISLLVWNFFYFYEYSIRLFKFIFCLYFLRSLLIVYIWLLIILETINYYRFKKIRENELMEINFRKQMKALKKWEKKLEIWRIKKELKKREKNERSKNFILKMKKKKCEKKEKKEKKNTESKIKKFNIKFLFKYMVNKIKKVCGIWEKLKLYCFLRVKYERYRWLGFRYIWKCKWLGTILKVKYVYYSSKLFFVSYKWKIIRVRSKFNFILEKIYCVYYILLNKKKYCRLKTKKWKKGI